MPSIARLTLECIPGAAKSSLLTLGGLVAGTVVGGLLQGLVAAGLQPVGGLHSPGAFIAEFALLGLWASSTFLRA